MAKWRINLVRAARAPLYRLLGGFRRLVRDLVRRATATAAVLALSALPLFLNDFPTDEEVIRHILSVPRHYAIVLVQHTSSDATGTTGTVTFSSTTTAGNIILVTARSGGTATTTMADDKAGGSNTYNTDVTLSHASFGAGYIFSAPNAGAAKVLTWTNSVSASIRIAIFEYSGIATSSPLDKTSSLYTSGSPTSADSGSTATTTQAAELLVGVLCLNAANCGTTTAGTSQSYAIEERVPADPNARLVSEDVVVAATGTYKADFTWANASSADAICLIATYKAAGGVAVDYLPWLKRGPLYEEELEEITY